MTTMRPFTTFTVRAKAIRPETPSTTPRTTGSLSFFEGNGDFVIKFFTAPPSEATDCKKRPELTDQCMGTALEAINIGNVESVEFQDSGRTIIYMRGQNHDYETNLCLKQFEGLLSDQVPDWENHLKLFELEEGGHVLVNPDSVLLVQYFEKNFATIKILPRNERDTSLPNKDHESCAGFDVIADRHELEKAFGGRFEAVSNPTTHSRDIILTLRPQAKPPTQNGRQPPPAAPR